MISIIVPAHNEAGVIHRTLRTMLTGATPGELEIIVVPNGCTDGTAEAARSVPGPIRVLETAVASKSHALNLGDSAARGFPRFYVDADIALPLESIRQVAAVLRGNRPESETAPLAGAPRMVVNLDGRPWCVRAFYGIWTRLPYCSQNLIGCGVYALSEQGRGRFTSFPDIISDDGYIRLLFKPGERVSVGDVTFEIQAPHTLSSLIKVKTRSQYGKYQLHATFPELLDNDGRSYGRPLQSLARQPRLWPSLLIFCCVLAAARIRSLLRYAAGQRRAWDRDDTTRAVPRPSGRGVHGTLRPVRQTVKPTSSRPVWVTDEEAIRGKDGERVQPTNTTGRRRVEARPADRN